MLLLLFVVFGYCFCTVLICLDVSRYLHEVVQKAMTVTMDSHGDEDENVRGTNPLLAAYEVCHDLCCGMVLEILHAQAVKLASRVRGLWATQLVVIFHKETQVRLLRFERALLRALKFMAPNAELCASG